MLTFARHNDVWKIHARVGPSNAIHCCAPMKENYFRLLKESGYHVQWYGKNDAPSQAAFNLSVSAWEPAIGYDSGKNAFPFGQSGYWSMTSTGGQTPANDTSQGDLRAVKLAVEFLQQKPSPPEPFVIFLPTRGAHPPYGAPPEYQKKWTNEEIREHVKLRPSNLPKKPISLGHTNTALSQPHRHERRGLLHHT